MKELQSPLKEIQPIKQKFFINEKDQLNHDIFEQSLTNFFIGFKSRLYYSILAALFFLGLLIPAIILQQNVIEIDIVPENGTKFQLNSNWDPPIALSLFSKTSYLLIDTTLYLDEIEINSQIEQQLLKGQQYNLKSNKTFILTVRMMTQYSYVPTSYLIILSIMLIISLIYVIFQYVRIKKL